MVQVDKLAETIFSLLKGYGFKIKIFDEDGNETTDPTAGRRFFVADPNFMITVDDDNNDIEFSKGASVDFNQANVLQKRLRKIADSFLVNSTIKVFGKSIQPRDFSYKAKMMKENELSDIESHTLQEGLSKMYGSKRTSHQTLENVKIIVRHKKPVNEEIRGARSRSISAIFLECNGERFRFPSNHLAGARAMAQHMAHGGTMYDKVGNYISENTAWLAKLQEFTRYVTTNGLINESSADIVTTVKENILSIKHELKKLTGVKTYETVSARIISFEQTTLSETDVSPLKDMFTIRRFDEKFEEVLPIVNRLIQEKDTYHKRIEEAASNSVKLRKVVSSVSPVLEFASKNAAIGYKLNELSSLIIENDELASFVKDVGSKLSKDGSFTEFERVIVDRVLENMQLDVALPVVSELTESVMLEQFYDKYDFILFKK